MTIEMKRILVLLIIMLVPLVAMAQSSVSGTVVEKEGSLPVISANIIIKNANGKIIAFTATDEDGHFSMNIESLPESSTINVTKVGLKTYTAPLKVGSTPLVIRMEEGTVMLTDVMVKAERIRESGDTVSYIVNSFAQEQDRSIGDVLKRMPGIDVEKNGMIKYQGIDINKFYIEGSDLLGGKYGIATNGIAYDDIGAVEVLENHQPMQVLRGLSFSDQAAINLKMKNSSKASFLVHGNVGGGWSEQPKGMLWQSDIFTMMITDKYQMITTLQGNNTGVNISEQLTDFTPKKTEEDIGGYVRLSIPSAKNLQQSRTYFNRSLLASSSHLWKTPRGNEVKAQVDYIKDRVTAEGTNVTTYLLDSGNKLLEEDLNSLVHDNAVTSRFSYESNENKYFLNNTLSADLSWNDQTLNTAGTITNMQTARLPRYSVKNALKLIKRFGDDRLVTFTSRNEWRSLPERLIIRQREDIYGQKNRQQSFYTNEKASMGYVSGKALISLEGGVSGYLRRLNSDLWGLEDEGIQMHEALTTDYLRLFASPKVEWSSRKIEMTIEMPLNMYSYFFSGAIGNRTEVFASPSASMRWKVKSHMSFALRGGAHRTPPSLHDIHDSSILSDYRSFSSGADDYYASSGQYLSASYNYRNAQLGLFANLSGSYTRNHSKYGTVQNIIDNYIFYSYNCRPSDSNVAVSFFNISKTLDSTRGAIGLKGSFSHQNGSLTSQGLPVEYTLDYLTISPFINGNVSAYMNYSFSLELERDILGFGGMPRQATDNMLCHSTLVFTPCKLITWTTALDYYHNQIDSDSYKDMPMLDSKLSFNVSERIEISASVNNIMNKQQYSYTSYGTMSILERSSSLRGREFLVSFYLKK